MVNLITGAIALLLVIVFFGQYALTLNTLPLWIIISVALALAVYDYVTSLRRRPNGD